MLCVNIYKHALVIVVKFAIDRIQVRSKAKQVTSDWQIRKTASVKKSLSILLFFFFVSSVVNVVLDVLE